jgi:2-dehydropantoate 2-reductase
MKYLIIGAGAMGSALAAFMHGAGKDVTLLTRGDNLAAIRANGVTVKTAHGEELTEPVAAKSEADYSDVPDVVLVCVKSYSLDSVFPLLDKVCTPDTIVLSVINGLNVGDRIEAGMAEPARIMEGVAYVAVQLVAPGVVKQKMDLFRFVLGARNGHDAIPEGADIQGDLQDAGLDVELSANMLQSALRKFVRVSALSAAQVYYDTNAGGVRENPEAMQYLLDLGTELVDIAAAAGIPLVDDAVAELESAVRGVDPAYTTSLMVDYEAGRKAEVESQFFDVYDLGRSLGLEMTAYGRVSEKVGYAGAAAR